MKKLLLAVAALCAMSILPAFAEHEWAVVDGAIQNDLWTLGNSTWNKGTLSLSTGIAPKVDGLTELDLSNISLYNEQLASITCWSATANETIRKMVLPGSITKGVTIASGAMKNLEELCTPDGGHTFSFGTWGNGNGIAPGSKVSGVYVINDISGVMSTKAFQSCTRLNGLEMNGAFTTIADYTACGCYALESLAFNTTATITAIPDQLCGDWGDKAAPGATCQLTSLTLNGTPLLRNPDITKVGNNPGSGYGALAHCSKLTDIIDLPACTSAGDYSFRNTGVPFANLMKITGIGAGVFAKCAFLDRVVLGADAQPALSSNSKGGLFESAFGSVASPIVIWNAKTAPASLPTKVFESVADNKVTNYIRKEATGWASLASAVRQQFVSMDTVFKVNLRLNGEPMMTTLMPGVSGQDSTWTIPASWFLLPGQSFGEGSVKDAKDDLVDVATVSPDGSGLNLTITLPASLVQSVDTVTQDVELYVDMIAQESRDPRITITIEDEEGETIVSDQFEATVGTSVEKNYSSEIFKGSTYFYTKVISTVVDPDSALNATLDLTGKLLLEAIAKDANVTIVINRKLRPVQQDHWTLSADKLSMTDGLWTFRCDFTDDKAVVANASDYAGAETECSTVDFAKPVFDDQAQLCPIKSLNWGATIGGTAIDVTKSANHYGKDIVIGGGGIPRTLIGCVKLPTTPLELFAGWGGCESLTNAASDFAAVTNLGAYALCDTQVSGSLSFPPEVAVNIGNYAFYDCKKLTSITVPGLYSQVGTSAFQGASKLESADLSGVVSIGTSAFNQVSVLKVVLCPVLQSFKESVFSRAASGLQLSVAQPTDEMRKLPAIDGIIEREAFRDYRGTHAITIPFRGRVTQTAVNSFKWLGPCTNIVFWGKAPAEGTFTKDAITEQGASQSYTRRMTASRAMDEEGWIAWATPCTAEEKARTDYPGDDVCFGTYDVNGAKFWMCWGKSPWEKGGLVLIIR